VFVWHLYTNLAEYREAGPVNALDLPFAKDTHLDTEAPHAATPGRN